jgi:hypothetical protein
MLYAGNTNRDQEKSAVSALVLGLILLGCILVEYCTSLHLPTETIRKTDVSAQFSLKNAKSHLALLSAMEPRIAGKKAVEVEYFCNTNVALMQYWCLSMQEHLPTKCLQLP